MENNRPVNDKALVSVVCIAYNQEAFIAKALESFVSQKTNFKYQILVGEDKGTDSTSKIILEYAEKYPDLIIPFIREKNMGAQRNLIDLCNRAGTPYIAFCEGDDYWVDENKLQKQFDFMEEHPECNVCFHDAEILIDTKNAEWFQSKAYYDKKTGLYIYPRALKGFDETKTIFELEEFLELGFIQTSSIFYRWNYECDIPEWYYHHQLGDYTLTAMQVGRGLIGYIPEIMSVYRKHEGGVYYFEDMDEYFLKTRMDWINLLNNLKSYFEEHYLDEYCVATLESRINRETVNYLDILMTYDEYDDFAKYVSENSKVVMDSFKWILNEHRSYAVLKKRLSAKAIEKMLKSRKFARQVREKIEKLMSLRTKNYRKRKAKKKRRIRRTYWLKGLVKKQKNLWVFTSFRGEGYLDNTKYLFEYIIKHHPEINAVWLTRDEDVFDYLTEIGYPVYMMDSSEGKRIMSHARLAFTDHFKMSDYLDTNINCKTGVVQLWHGVGLKDLDGFKQTNVPGVRLSRDIISRKKDSIYKRIKKKIKFFKKAPFRELCERYFLLLGPGEEPITSLGKTNRTRKKNWFVCGYPRNELLYSDSKPDKYRILYAPTYRWSAKKEKQLVRSLINFVPQLSEFLEKNDAEFVIRLHPHTWRDYDKLILRAIKHYPRIKIDDEKDIYQTLNTYSLVISDYSSIVYDFLILDRPTVYYCPDYYFYLESEGNFKHPFDEYTPGPKTSTWEDTIKEVERYMENPQKDKEFRKKVYDFFYDDSVNDKDNSERIINELKRRLELS